MLMEKQSSSEITNNVNSALLDQLGATFKLLDKDLKSKLKINNGVQIDDLKVGILSNAGIKKGFIITRVDKKPIQNVEDLMSYLQNKDGGILIEGVYPDGMRAYYGFGL